MCSPHYDVTEPDVSYNMSGHDLCLHRYYIPSLVMFPPHPASSLITSHDLILSGKMCERAWWRLSGWW